MLIVFRIVNCTLVLLVLPVPRRLVYPQICINIHPDATPPIHAESYHVATDKGPLQVPVYF